MAVLGRTSVVLRPGVSELKNATHHRPSRPNEPPGTERGERDRQTYRGVQNVSLGGLRAQGHMLVAVLWEGVVFRCERRERPDERTQRPLPARGLGGEGAPLSHCLPVYCLPVSLSPCLPFSRGSVYPRLHAGQTQCLVNCGSSSTWHCGHCGVSWRVMGSRVGSL